MSRFFLSTFDWWSEYAQRGSRFLSAGGVTGPGRYISTDNDKIKEVWFLEKGFAKDQSIAVGKVSVSADQDFANGYTEITILGMKISNASTGHKWWWWGGKVVEQ